MAKPDFKVSKSAVKGELYAIDLDGVRIGNFRKTDKHWRYGIRRGTTDPQLFELTLSAEQVAEAIAQQHIEARDAKVKAKEAAKKLAEDAKAEKAASDGPTSAKAKPAAKPRATRKAAVKKSAAITAEATA